MKTKVKTCKDCGRSFDLTAEEQQKFIAKGLNEPTRCPECRVKNRTVEHIPCIDCGTPFPFSELDKEFYTKMGWKEPKRCSECRIKRREAGGK